MAIARMEFKCGHVERHTFAYERAARDWERYAKEELCAKCEEATRKEEVKG